MSWMRAIRRPALAVATLSLVAALCDAHFALATAPTHSPGARLGGDSAATIPLGSDWPEGTAIVHFENLEGAILLCARIVGLAGNDSAGPLVLDTGAGYVALDFDLARRLELTGPADVPNGVGYATRALPRLEVGSWSMDQIAPVLTVDADIIRRAIDRPVLGLLGEQPLGGRALWIDYESQTLALIPSLADTSGGEAGAIATSRRTLGSKISPQARAAPFRLVGDGKVLIRARVLGSQRGRECGWLNLVLDTGATKTVFFEPSFSDAVPESKGWPALRGLLAPTLVGEAEARMVRTPGIEVRLADSESQVSPSTSSGERHATHDPLSSPAGDGARQEGVDAACIESELAQVLSRVAGETVHGLLGYSFLRRYRVTIDYPNRVVWLDPVHVSRDQRPFEYSNVGIQIERRDGAVRVAAVAEGSPAAKAGIAPGDELVAIDGKNAVGRDLVSLGLALEGPPGSAVILTLSHASRTRDYRLARRWLL